MKIVVLDGYVLNPGDLTWGILGDLGDLKIYDRTPVEDTAEIIRRISDAEIVITNKTPITREVLDACPGIRMIDVLATGYNIVDVTYAAQKGIPVSNVPGYGTPAVAQFTFGLLLEICLHIREHSNGVHSGKWSACPDFCYWDYPLIELAGKTIGIMGFGNIGRQVGRIADAMGMRVLAYSRTQCEEGRRIAEYTDLDTLLAESDIISLHLPLFPETKEIINRENIAKMKDGVIILNTGRGPLINEQDLADALNSGKVYAAGLDVVSTEPIRPDNPLLSAKNCIITPHIAWAQKESRQRLMDIAVGNVKAYLDGKPVNVVNG